MNYFDEYIEKYDMSDPDINYKYYHSYRVMNNMELLARCLNLSIYDIELAKCIGLLHDIGRFEQDKLYNSFKDDKMDHGNYGVEVIKKEKFLSKFNIKEEDYEVVYKAIKNHNKYNIQTNINPRELLFAKLIRDADKLDIMNALSDKKIKPVIYEDDGEISKDIKEKFLNNKSIEATGHENKNDNILLIFGMIFDINYDITLRIMVENNFHNKIYQRLENKHLFKPYIDHINNYIKERIGNNVR